MESTQNNSTPAPTPVSLVSSIPWKVFLQRVFSDSGEPSSSRVLTFTLAAVCSVLLCVIVHHICRITDPGQLGLWLTSFPAIVCALVAFVNAPYLINRGSGSMSDFVAIFKKGDR